MNEEGFGFAGTSRKLIGAIFSHYITSKKCDSMSDTIPAQMWLSVADVAQKFENDEIATFAKAKFYEKFDWSQLQTPKPWENDQQEATGGRKVKN